MGSPTRGGEKGIRPLQRRGEKKLVPFPLMEEGQDKGESPRMRSQLVALYKIYKNIPVFSE